MSSACLSFGCVSSLWVLRVISVCLVSVCDWMDMYLFVVIDIVLAISFVILVVSMVVGVVFVVVIPIIRFVVEMMLLLVSSIVACSYLMCDDLCYLVWGCGMWVGLCGWFLVVNIL